MMEGQEETPVQPKPEKAKTGPVMYLGPSAFGLQSLQVFKGGIPAVHAENPLLVRLFVSVGKICAARAALTVEGSPEWSAYRDAAMVVFKKRGAK